MIGGREMPPRGRQDMGSTFGVRNHGAHFFLLETTEAKTELPKEEKEVI